MGSVSVFVVTIIDRHVNLRFYRDGLSTLAVLAPPHSCSVPLHSFCPLKWCCSTIVQIHLLLAQCARDLASSPSSSPSPAVAAAWLTCVQHTSDAIDRWPELSTSPALSSAAAVRAQCVGNFVASPPSPAASTCWQVHQFSSVGPPLVGCASPCSAVGEGTLCRCVNCDRRARLHSDVRLRIWNHVFPRISS